jgi:hypothetical protein
MNWFKKLIMFLFGIKIDDLLALVEVQQKQIKLLSAKSFITIDAPKDRDDLEKMNAELSDISKKRFFNFYLMSIENEMLVSIRDCPIEKAQSLSLQARGGLQIISRIRDDLRRAESGEVGNGLLTEDIILQKMNALFNSGSKN